MFLSFYSFIFIRCMNLWQLHAPDYGLLTGPILIALFITEMVILFKHVIIIITAFAVCGLTDDGGGGGGGGKT